MPTEIKICGLRSPEEAREISSLHPDYVGLMFAPSRRQVTVSQARAILKVLDTDIQTVGVLVNMDREEADNLRRELGLDILQLHGDETLSYLSDLGGRLWKTLSPETGNREVEEVLAYAEKVLVDSGNSRQRGGTGQTFDWTKLESFSDHSRLVLAGGLHPGNVRAAIEQLRPGCIDVSSGVETGDRKDPEKVRRLIREVRSWG